jgi:hypothetical protein
MRLKGSLDPFKSLKDQIKSFLEVNISLNLILHNKLITIGKSCIAAGTICTDESSFFMILNALRVLAIPRPVIKLFESGLKRILKA